LADIILNQSTKLQSEIVVVCFMQLVYPFCLFECFDPTFCLDERKFNLLMFWCI